MDFEDPRENVVVSTGRVNPLVLSIARRMSYLMGREKVIIARESGQKGRANITQFKHDDTEDEPRLDFQGDHEIGRALYGRRVVVVSTQGINPSFKPGTDFRRIYEEVSSMPFSSREMRGVTLRLLRHGWVRSIPEASSAKLAMVHAAYENHADCVHLVEPYSFREASDRGPWSHGNKRVQRRGDEERKKLDGQAPGLELEAFLEKGVSVRTKILYHPHSLDDTVKAYHRQRIRLMPLSPVPLMASILRTREKEAIEEGQPRKAVVVSPDLGAYEMTMEVIEQSGLDYLAHGCVVDKIKEGARTKKVVFDRWSSNYGGCEGARVYSFDDIIRSAATMRVQLNTIVEDEGVPIEFNAVASHSDARSPRTQGNLREYDQGGTQVPINVYLAFSKPQLLDVCGPLLDSVRVIDHGALIGDAVVRCALNGADPAKLYTPDFIEQEGLYRVVGGRQLYDELKLDRPGR